MLPDEQRHDPARLIRESANRLKAPMPYDAEQDLFESLHLGHVDFARAPCGLFAAEVLLELRHQVEEEQLVLSYVLHVSMPSSMSFQIELKNPKLPD